jgi:hypothetical protein
MSPSVEICDKKKAEGKALLFFSKGVYRSVRKSYFFIAVDKEGK